MMPVLIPWSQYQNINFILFLIPDGLQSILDNGKYIVDIQHMAFVLLHFTSDLNQDLLHTSTLLCFYHLLLLPTTHIFETVYDIEVLENPGHRIHVHFSPPKKFPSVFSNVKAN